MTTKEQVLEIIKGEIYLCPSSKTDVIEELNKLIQYVTSEVQDPKVYQLVWYENIGNAFVIEKVPYNYEIYHNKYCDNNYELWFADTAINVFDTLSEAKAYSQEHFEGLIRGCYE